MVVSLSKIEDEHVDGLVDSELRLQRISAPSYPHHVSSLVGSIDADAKKL